MSETSSDRDQIIRRRLFDAGGRVPPARPASAPSPARGPDRLATLRDRVPVSLQGLTSLRWAHVAAVALVVAGALLAGAWWTARSGPSGEIVPMAASTPSAGSTAVALPSPVVSEVVVDVAGGVRRPGVYHLAAGSRVIDALKLAGGALRGVDLSQVNRARVLVDGEQILLVRRRDAAISTGAQAPGSRVNINTADQTLLETLPGVGPVTAASILQWRQENGPFSSVDGLLDVSGIGEATLARLRPYVTV